MATPIPTLYELACLAYNPTGETTVGRRRAWEQMSWELINPNQVKPDLIIEKVPAPPKESIFGIHPDTTPTC